VKKTKGQLDAAQMLLDAGAPDKSYAEFHTILAAEPDNVDANLGAGYPCSRVAIKQIPGGRELSSALRGT